MKSYCKTLIFLVLIFFHFKTFSQQPPKDSVHWAIHLKTNELANLFKLDSAVYRSRQPSRSGFKELDVLGIKSVLNLRYIKSDKPKDSKLILYKIPMRAKKIKDADIVNALKTIEQSPKPIVIHCLHGADRTGAVCAMYRIIYHGWSKQQAIDELLNGGFGFHTYYRNIPEYIEKIDIESIKKQLGK